MAKGRAALYYKNTLALDPYTSYISFSFRFDCSGCVNKKGGREGSVGAHFDELFRERLITIYPLLLRTYIWLLSEPRLIDGERGLNRR